MFKVSKSGNWSGYRKLLKEFNKRLNYAMKNCVNTAAQRGVELVQDKIPDGEDDRDYRDSIIAKPVASSERGAVGAVITSSLEEMSQKHIRDLKSQHDVVYIRVKRPFGVEVDEWLNMLEELSPWTLDTLPLIPSEKQAKTYYRRVSKDEIVQVRKLRTSQRKRINAVLKRAGINYKETLKGIDMDPAVQEVKVMPDTAFNALRMEFGLGDTRANPHWRPMVQKMKTTFSGEYARSNEMSDVLTNPNNKDWKKSSTGPSISEGDAIKFVKFQKKIS